MVLLRQIGSDGSGLVAQSKLKIFSYLARTCSLVDWCTIARKEFARWRTYNKNHIQKVNLQADINLQADCLF